MQITPDGLGVKTMIGSDVDGRNDGPGVVSLDGSDDGDDDWVGVGSLDGDDEGDEKGDDDGPGVG